VPQKKCSWKLAADETSFRRPRNYSHTYVDKSTYIEQTIQEKSFTAKHLTGSTNIAQQHHQSRLLATLASYTPPAAAKDMLDFNSEDVSTSSSVTETGGLQNHIAKMRICLEQERKEFQLIQQTLEDEIIRIKSEYREKLLNLSFDLEQECDLRLYCQNSLSRIEIDKEYLPNKVEILSDEYSSYREAKRLETSSRKKRGERNNNKCIVCYQRPIEYLFIPCYHYGKWLVCLSEFFNI
jgi:hypothetical protein